MLAASQASVIVANVTDKTIDLFANAEPELVPLLAEISVDQTGRIMKEWAARANAAVDADNGADPEPETDHLHFSPLMDGRSKLDGQLSGDNSKVVEEGLNACLPDLKAKRLFPAFLTVHCGLEIAVDGCAVDRSKAFFQSGFRNAIQHVKDRKRLCPHFAAGAHGDNSPRSQHRHLKGQALGGAVIATDDELLAR